MTDHSELKRLAEAATPGPWYQHGGIMQVLSHDCETVCETFEDDGECPDAQFIAAANPAAVLALIAENERLTKAVGLQVIRRFVGDDDQKNIDELVAAGIQVDKELIVQLKAENERLAAACERAEQIIIVECKAASLAKVRANLLEANRDQLRAEVVGLKTGYEAYERVNAELKAENEALRANSSLVVLLPELDSVLEDLEIHGQHSDQGYRKLKDWYRKVNLSCKAIDAAMGKGEQS